MCGIAGIACRDDLPPPSLDSLDGMCRTIVHRGPDEQGMAVHDRVGMAMRRLSIIDLAGGAQPIYNEDRSVWVVFNGEIYNYRELRRELESAGHVFRTNSDTEVIVHAYEELGPDFPNALNGMFAFSLHDARRRKLVLARDHIGIKPLYYFFNGSVMVWGSEIKAILATGLVPRRLNLDGLAQFLSWEYIPGRGSLFQSVHKLLPAEMMELNLATFSWKRRSFWDVPVESHPTAPRTCMEWEEELDGRIRESVRRQLISDVPLGAFLSGGVDSSLVVAAMGAPKTFSIGFDDPSYNELKWARRVAEHLGVDHLDAIIEPNVRELFWELIYYMDDPIGDFSIFPTYLVSKHARRKVTVALSGDGGDEVFGGYETYLAEQRVKDYRHVPGFMRGMILEPLLRSIRPRPEKKGLINKAKRFLEGLEQPEGLGHARWRIFMDDSLLQALFLPEVIGGLTEPPEGHVVDLFSRAGARDPVNRCLYVDLKSYLVDNCLVKVDRMSMAVSLEARVPLLDKDLVELGFQIPGDLKVSKGRTKVILKRVAARHIPRECVYRPKEGFSIPIKNWLKKELKPLMQELLDPLALLGEGVFKVDTVERLKREHLSGQANHSHVLWSLMVFQAWRRKWLEG
ncbi:MAG: asparagine synthase (glutamine-hydrolyzing) [Syntrophobacteraceae bacterium]|jgi:asparagine synthase (glutamine-hydrolysing)|nr:asparagine synthase (glutamine-hydrolyzing) [Syntrophobacteraceae bacterium]